MSWDKKLTGLTELTSVATTDMLYVVDDPSGTPISKKSTVTNILAWWSAVIWPASATDNATVRYDW